MELAGLSPDGRLVEIIELRDHPWFVGSQFHPEFKSRPDRPHPLFQDFIGAAKVYRQSRLDEELEMVGERLPEESEAASPLTGSGH
jgi:hypothetical protein